MDPSYSKMAKIIELPLERKKSALKILAVKAQFNNLARPRVGSNDDL